MEWVKWQWNCGNSKTVIWGDVPPAEGGHVSFPTIIVSLMACMFAHAQVCSFAGAAPRQVKVSVWQHCRNCIDLRLVRTPQVWVWAECEISPSTPPPGWRLPRKVYQCLKLMKIHSAFVCESHSWLARNHSV